MGGKRVQAKLFGGSDVRFLGTGRGSQLELFSAADSTAGAVEDMGKALAAWVEAARGLTPDGTAEPLRLRELPAGVLFRFAPGQCHPAVQAYESRGSGWYDVPGGYAGGPWGLDVEDNPVVIVVRVADSQTSGA